MKDKNFEAMMAGAARTAMEVLLYVSDEETIAKEHIFSKELKKDMCALLNNDAVEENSCCILS